MRDSIWDKPRTRILTSFSSEPPPSAYCPVSFSCSTKKLSIARAWPHLNLFDCWADTILPLILLNDSMDYDAIPWRDANTRSSDLDADATEPPLLDYYRDLSLDYHNVMNKLHRSHLTSS